MQLSEERIIGQCGGNEQDGVRTVGPGFINLIFMDDKVLSAPRVNGVIEKGEAVITGNFSMEEARTLSGYLRSGGLSGAQVITKFQLIKKK
jgi:hypothetical protein